MSAFKVGGSEGKGAARLIRVLSRHNLYAMFSVIASVVQPGSLVIGLLAVPILVILYHLAVFLIDHNGLRSIPGPFLAKLTDAWFGVVALKGLSCEVVYDLHKQYGMSFFVDIRFAECTLG